MGFRFVCEAETSIIDQRERERIVKIVQQNDRNLLRFTNTERERKLLSETVRFMQRWAGSITDIVKAERRTKNDK